MNDHFNKKNITQRALINSLYKNGFFFKFLIISDQFEARFDEY